jgi:hypothetical protein
LTANTTRWQLENSTFSFYLGINFLSGFKPLSGMVGGLMNPILKPWIRWLLNEEATGASWKSFQYFQDHELASVNYADFNAVVCFGGATVFGDVGPARTRNDSSGGFSNQPLSLLNSGPFT